MTDHNQRLCRAIAFPSTFPVVPPWDQWDDIPLLAAHFGEYAHKLQCLEPDEKQRIVAALRKMNWMASGNRGAARFWI